MSHNNIELIIDTMGTAARINRQKAADYFVKNPKQIEELIKLTFNTQYKYHHKAAWVLEFVLKNNIYWIVPHIDFFSEHLSALRKDSAIRPISKICQWIANEYVVKQQKIFCNQLTIQNINKIIEASFDWIIGNYKVAAQVYAMDTLYHFGSLANSDLKWIHLELKNILLKSLANGSAGYKAHAIKIVSALN